MDHLPTPSKPVGGGLPRVPYLGCSFYKYTAPFDTFYKRTFAADPSTTQEQFSQFVQQWLFFGLLRECFAVWDLPIQDDDFVTQEGEIEYVSTRVLDEYLLAAYATELQVYHKYSGDQTLSGTSGRDIENYRVDRVIKLSTALDTAYSAICELETDTQTHLLLPEIWDSVVILAATLSRAAEQLYKARENTKAVRHWPTQDLGKFHLRSIADFRDNESWCPAEKDVITQLVGGRLPELAFLAQLDQKEAPHISHDRCVGKIACEAHQIDDKAIYQTRHSTDGCRCDFVGVEPSNIDTVEDEPSATFSAKSKLSLVPEILTKKVSAVTFTDGTLQAVTIQLAKTKLSTAFRTPLSGANLVAISHVWADGLGNRKSNSLPTCQLARLQQLVNELFPEKQHPIPFWIDTLMIPVHGNRVKKNKALEDMEWIYKNASKILVLDYGLLHTNIGSLTGKEEEIGARIMCSTWSRRLWTLQEGCIQDRTFFMFEDQAQGWPDLHMSVRKRAKLSDAHKNSRLDEGHPVRKAQKLDWYQTRDKTKSSHWYGSSSYSKSGWPMFDAMSLDEVIYQTLYPVWHSILTFLEDMTIQHDGDLRGEALAHCMRGMFYRNCSKREDEVLVLASMLSHNSGLPAKFPRPAQQPTEAKKVKEPDDRLRLLFKELHKVPQEILFLDQCRYEDAGCGWIPVSLLRVRSASSIPMQQKDKIYNEPRLLIAMTRKNANLCVHNEHGLVTGLDGVCLHPRKLQAPFSFRAFGDLWSASVRYPGTLNDWQNPTEADWVLIPEAAIQLTPRPMQCRAALVQVVSWAKDRRGGIAKFEGLCQLVKVPDNDDNHQNALSIMVGADQPDSFLRDVNAMSTADIKKSITPRLATSLGRAAFMKDVMQDQFVNVDKWIVG